MHKILLILAHVAPSVGPRYQAAVGADVKVAAFVVPGAVLSSGYVAFAERLRGRGAQRPAPFLDALLTYLGVAEEDRELPIVVGGYSAAYALVRELCRAPEDRARIAGWLLLDGGHAPLERDGTADDGSVAWLVELVRDAAEGRTVLAYGHSDVDPIRYASTMRTIGEAMRLAKAVPPAIRTACPGCRFSSKVVMAQAGLLVEAHDHRLDPVQEHVDVLRAWGDELAARAVEMVRSSHEEAVRRPRIEADSGAGGGLRGDDEKGFEHRGGGGEEALPPTARDDAAGEAPRSGENAGVGARANAASLGLGERALVVALRELEAGGGEEPPGSNGGPKMVAYLAGATRNGKAVGLRAAPWCAGFVGYCDREALNQVYETTCRAREPLVTASVELDLNIDALTQLDALNAELEAIEDWFDGQDVRPLGMPCRWRAAVWELVADARAAGAWREAAEYSPLSGDLAVFQRAGGDPRQPGQEGHVGRVETAPSDDGNYVTIDGNHDNRVARVERNTNDGDLVGWIAYPRPAAPPAYHVDTEDLAAGAAALGLDRTARDTG